MILTFTLLLALAAPSVPTSIPKAIPSDAPNCALEAPPESAGEILEHGSVTKVYPRLPDLPRKYTGCQMTWVPVDETLVLAGIVYYKKGKPSLMWSPVFEDPEVVCEYRRKKPVSGSDDSCPAYEELSVPSMPAGCAKKLADGSADESRCPYE